MINEATNGLKILCELFISPHNVHYSLQIHPLYRERNTLHGREHTGDTLHRKEYHISGREEHINCHNPTGCIQDLKQEEEKNTKG